MPCLLGLPSIVSRPPCNHPHPPQVILNWRLRSTAGWNMHNVALDFSGGLLSLAQLMLDGAYTQDWSAVTGARLCFSCLQVVQPPGASAGPHVATPPVGRGSLPACPRCKPLRMLAASSPLGVQATPSSLRWALHPCSSTSSSWCRSVGVVVYQW